MNYTPYRNIPNPVFQMVIEAIEAARKAAIADGSLTMPLRPQLCKQTGVSDGYFYCPNESSRLALKAYQEAVRSLNILREAKGLEPVKLSRNNQRTETYPKVIAAIESAKRQAIATGGKMPTQKFILQQAGANLSYFCQQNPYATYARNAYSAAVEAIKSHAKTRQRSRPQLVPDLPPNPTIETDMEDDRPSSKPSKEAQLLAHLRWQTLPIKRISRLLDIPEGSVRPMVDRLVREGKIAIKPEPFAKDNKEDAIVLVQQQRRVG